MQPHQDPRSQTVRDMVSRIPLGTDTAEVGISTMLAQLTGFKRIGGSSVSEGAKAALQVRMAFMEVMRDEFGASLCGDIPKVLSAQKVPVTKLLSWIEAEALSKEELLAAKVGYAQLKEEIELGLERHEEKMTTRRKEILDFAQELLDRMDELGGGE